MYQGKLRFRYLFNVFYVPESFNMNFSHQLFDYKTFVNSQDKISKGDFVLKNWFETFVLNTIHKHLMLKIPYTVHTQHEFLTFNNH